MPRRAGSPARIGLVLLTLAPIAVWASLLGPARNAAATEVRFALGVDYPLLQGALRRHLHEQAGGALELWRTADGCGSVVMRDVTIQPREGRLRISGRTSAEAGASLFGLCWGSVTWEGYAEILGRPEVGADWRLRLIDLDTQLYDLNRQSGGIAGAVWTLLRGFAEAQIGRFTLDLSPQAAEIRSLLGLFAGTARSSPLLAALPTLRPVGVTAENEAVRVIVALDIPATLSAPRGPEAALTPTQVKAWEAALDRWDGFLGFVVKDLAGATPDPAVRQELLDLLLAARHDLVGILGRGPEPGADPVKALFLSVWGRLRAIARRIPAPPGDEARALRLLVFLTAGDALAAIDATAPSAGVEFSADGLRRLAKGLDPRYLGDPLQYSQQPDPKLRELFRFRDPDAPPRRLRPKPAEKTPGPGSWRWLSPRPAYADAIQDAQDEWVGLGRRLDRWVPSPADSGAYHATVDRLLVVAAERALDPDILDERYDDLFHTLQKAVAWQESCWRQFVRRGDTVTYLLSRTGDVGLMQINIRVWRGFFNPDRLRWNAAYNAGAGTEILLHHLVRYGVREARERFDNAARATYAAYNGGPARYRRYRLATTGEASQAVDRAFWEKYRAVASGRANIAEACRPH
jgi:Transglycosylase SLT domain